MLQAAHGPNMNNNRWACHMRHLLVLLSWAVSWNFKAVLADKVPYTDGLTNGQGYNTYLQRGCRHGAVDIKPGPDTAPGDTNVQLSYTAELIKDYSKLAQMLDLSAGASISGLNKEGSVKARFLDRSEFEESFLTYVVRVDVQRQPSSTASYSLNWTSSTDPTMAYCDRFISDFITGGALFGRVSIITKDATAHEEVKQSAVAAFSMYGQNIKVTESMKQSIDTIQKHSEIKVTLLYVGAPPEKQQQLSKRSDDPLLLQVKTRADKFLADAQRHQWKRYALLDRYQNLPNWSDQFGVLDYSEADDLSWPVFEEFSKYQTLLKMVRHIGQDRFLGGSAKKYGLQDQASRVLQGYRDWVNSVSQSPEKARQMPQYEAPETFRDEMLGAVKTTRYIAQTTYPSSNLETDIIDTHLHSRAKKLFELEAFDYGDIRGTSNLIFGEKPEQQSYVCVMGRQIPAGYEQQSQLWVFDKQSQGPFNQSVDVIPWPLEGTIRLRKNYDGPLQTLFSFNVREV